MPSSRRYSTPSLVEPHIARRVYSTVDIHTLTTRRPAVAPYWLRPTQTSPPSFITLLLLLLLGRQLTCARIICIDRHDRATSRTDSLLAPTGVEA